VWRAEAEEDGYCEDQISWVTGPIAAEMKTVLVSSAAKTQASICWAEAELKVIGGLPDLAAC
jgi:hypothetical protein